MTETMKQAGWPGTNSGALRLRRVMLWALPCCVLLIPNVLPAVEVAPSDVTAAVETWVRQMTADGRGDAVVDHLESYPADGRVVAYIAHLRDGGYCICGADDALLPVTLYRAKGTYDPRDPNYQMILRDISRRLALIEAARARGGVGLEPYQDLLAQRRLEWQALAARRVPPSGPDRGDRAVPTSMTLHVTSCWHQGSPYNDDCPILTPGSDEHSVTGCVATATAQIMYYWKWPSNGVGGGGVYYPYRYSTGWLTEYLASAPAIPSDYAGRLQYNSYWHWLQMDGYWDNSIYYAGRGLSTDSAYLAAFDNLWARMTQGSANYSANFGMTSYYWNLMQDVHSDPPDAGDVEVAQFNEQVGIAELMDYGLWGSGSDHEKAEHALEVHFQYDPDSYNTTRNESTMMTEIQWLRPVQLAGAQDNPPGGHSWVVCGYNSGVSPVQFLMNFGWGGGSADWYSVDQVFPIGQTNLIQIAPFNMVKFVGSAASGDGSPSNPYHDIAQAASLAPDHATLIFKASSNNTFAGTSLTLNRPMTLRGYLAVIQPQ
jgi:hypothetical protein